MPPLARGAPVQPQTLRSAYPTSPTTVLAAPAYPGLNRPAEWMVKGVNLPGSYLGTVGLAMPGLHPDHLMLLAVTAV